MATDILAGDKTTDNVFAVDEIGVGRFDVSETAFDQMIIDQMARHQRMD